MNYEVAIQVLTFNQKDYIAQCLDSIVMQRTTFPFVVVVHDDASNDGTADIVRSYAERYPDVIHPIYQTQNQYSQGNSPAKIAAEEIGRINPKYKCILDGDDYWTDSESLQMRYDYLEAHPETAVVYTKIARMLMPSGEITEMSSSYRWEVPTLENLLLQNNIPINTAMFRLDLYREYLTEVKPFEKPWPINDWAIWLYMVAKYEVAFIDKLTCIYRVTPTSLSRKKTLWKRVKFINGLKQLSLYFSQYSQQPDIKMKIRRYFNKKMLVEVVDEIKAWIK